VNALQKFGRPTWASYNVPQGVNLSEQLRNALKTENGIVVDWRDLLISMCQEPILFVRIDLNDLPSVHGSRFLKAFLESAGRYPFLNQKRVAVLCCSIEDREKHHAVLDNVFGSGVCWEARE
jgi:hypothetical protein